MKLTDEQIEVIAKECNFDMTGRLMRFARLLLEAGTGLPQVDRYADMLGVDPKLLKGK